MHNLLRALFLLALFIINVPSHAESACGSDTSSDPDVARGKDVWLNGYCQSFLPCRLVLAQFHACQAVESFLTNLRAENGVPLTEEQVEAALVKTNQSSDVSTSPEKKPMSKNVALIERNRVGGMDAKAEALVQSNCGGFGCDHLLESTVDQVIREVEALNSNPEYLAHMPKYAPIASVETAARFGWKKDGAFWVSNGKSEASGYSANTSTLKDYLLSVPECQKLHDKLELEIKTDPTKEPVNLSFFEGECVPQLPNYQAEVARWRQGFKDVSSQLATVTQPAAPSDVIGAQHEVVQEHPAAIEALGDWNADIVAEISGEPRMLARRFDLQGGCYLYFYTFTDSAKATWSGPCVAGEPVNGTGNFSLEGQYDFRVDYQAAHIVNGRLEGGPYLDTFYSGESEWYELHTYTSGCDKEEFLGYDRDHLVYYEKRMQPYNGTPEGTDEEYFMRALKTHVLNRTYKGVNYYRSPSNADADAESDRISAAEYKHCLSAFTKLR